MRSFDCNSARLSIPGQRAPVERVITSDSSGDTEMWSTIDHPPLRRDGVSQSSIHSQSAIPLIFQPSSAGWSPLDTVPISSLYSTCQLTSWPSPLQLGLPNCHFQDGVFPSRYRYKGDPVTPLLTKPNLSPQDPANYTPISKLCTFFKILTKKNTNKTDYTCRRRLCVDFAETLERCERLRFLKRTIDFLSVVGPWMPITCSSLTFHCGHSLRLQVCE